MTTAPYKRHDMGPEELDHTPLDFGQYRGQTPSQIAEHDPRYLVFLAERQDHIASEALIRSCKDDLGE